MQNWQVIEEHISPVLDEPFQVTDEQSVGGGCINEAWRISDGNRSWFVKQNKASGLGMFEAEFRGLEEMASSRSVRVPTPVVTGVDGDRAFLVMEFIPMDGGNSAAQLGEQLAQMHRTVRGKYGWDIDNTIGSTDQLNNESDNWVDFWREQRLGFQVELAGHKGYRGKLDKLGDKLMEKFHGLFISYIPEASLLHGDLWGGNWSTASTGEPVIYDPAVYYGDRETDIAMTELFGGFSQDFYDAYNAAWPVDNGYVIRKTLYNLYHILNHLNLFGGSYGSQAERMMQSLLAELG